MRWYPIVSSRDFNEYTEDALTASMTAMREWLDHYHFEPTIFQHTFTKTDLLFQVYFDIETEAKMFAREFGGAMFIELKLSPQPERQTKARRARLSNGPPKSSA